MYKGEIAGVVANPGIAAFYSELTAKHPEVDDVLEEEVDDTNLCPWSVAFDRSDGHIIMCCVWSKADYVGELVKDMAAKHGLAFYDPQSDRLMYAGENAAPKPWWKLW